MYPGKAFHGKAFPGREQQDAGWWYQVNKDERETGKPILYMRILNAGKETYVMRLNYEHLMKLNY